MSLPLAFGFFLRHLLPGLSFLLLWSFRLSRGRQVGRLRAEGGEEDIGQGGGDLGDTGPGRPLSGVELACRDDRGGPSFIFPFKLTLSLHDFNRIIGTIRELWLSR